MTPGCTVRVCLCCGEAFTDERPQSLGNPSSCVPCACGIIFPPAESSEKACGALSDFGNSTAGGNPFPNGRWT